MQLINSISNGVSRAIDWTIDSSWGVGYWHSFPSSLIWSLWNSRFQQLVAYSLTAKVFSEKRTPYHSSSERIIDALLITLVLTWAWKTRCSFRPLDSALTKSLLANAAVVSLDTLSLLPFNEDPGPSNGAKKCLSAAWLLYRLADITLTWGNASDGLVRLNLDPTFSMWNWVQSWIPINQPV